jgi:hypothetical protein
MTPVDTLVGRIQLRAVELMRMHPPRWSHPNKKALFEHVCPPGTVHAGTVTFSRWAQRSLPMTALWAAKPLDGELRPDVFQYAPRSGERPGVDWHLNFAHSSLFMAYGGPLLAQDELQVVEHPVLAAVRECLNRNGDPRLQPTTREGQIATPVLIRGAERRCALATDELYGNAFARAPMEKIVKATRVLKPPTISNILAMEAPIGGSGRYRTEELLDVLATAYTGFCAAIEESRLATGVKDPEVVIHTGHWGTGAYGGHRVLMAMLQLIAARLAGVDRVVFHTVDEVGLRPCHEALERLGKLASLNLGAAVRAIDAVGFMWGAPNGT